MSNMISSFSDFQLHFLDSEQNAHYFYPNKVSKDQTFQFVKVDSAMMQIPFNPEVIF